MAKLFANSGDPDQTSRSAASDLHRLQITLSRVSRLQWVNKHNILIRILLYFWHFYNSNFVF